MTANVNPIFTLVPDVQIAGSLTAANTAMDGTGTVLTAFTASGGNGAWVDHIRIRALGTNVATVVRAFVNNGSTNATAGNNSLIDEIGLSATTASNTSPLPMFYLRIGFAIPDGYKINVCLGTAVAAGVQFTGVGGRY